MAIAKFEKVSYEQFKNDFVNTYFTNSEIDEETVDTIIRKIYNNIKLPRRATSGSAGYDFFIPMAVEFAPHYNIKIPTGIRCKIDDGYVLKVYPRSSLGFKYRMQLDNTVGIIDSDYYNADNEGHIFIKVTNDSVEDKDFSLNDGDAFAQGIFEKYYLAEEDEVNTKRVGGLGSTN